ncbi:DUF2277 domain-containing protein [Streptosporangium canum]|uniref:DUF2277 domain-containing protein n=1 Tax=Streptosporangium canum TaxID=324952 RepID=UPI0036CED994
MSYRHAMCRSIKTLREPYASDVTTEDVRAAALQYVRKLSGFRAPSARNAEAFDRAVDAVAAATQVLLEELQVKQAPQRHP